MARACVANRITDSNFIATALLIAGVPLQSAEAISAEDSTSIAEVTEVTPEEASEGLEAVALSADSLAEADTDISPEVEASPVNEAQILRTIAEHACVIPMLRNAKLAAIPKAVAIENGPLKEESVKAAEAGEMTVELQAVAEQWASMRLPSSPFTDMEGVISLYKDQIAAAENLGLIEQAFAKHVRKLTEELCKLKNAEPVVKFLHSVDPALQVVTMEAINEQKMRMQRFMQYFMKEKPQD